MDYPKEYLTRVITGPLCKLDLATHLIIMNRGVHNFTLRDIIEEKGSIDLLGCIAAMTQGHYALKQFDKVKEIFDIIYDKKNFISFRVFVEALDKVTNKYPLDNDIAEYVLNKLTDGNWKDPDFIILSKKYDFVLTTLIRLAVPSNPPKCKKLSEVLYQDLCIFDDPSKNKDKIFKALTLFVPFVKVWQGTPDGMSYLNDTAIFDNNHPITNKMAKHPKIFIYDTICFIKEGKFKIRSRVITRTKRKRVHFFIRDSYPDIYNEYFSHMEHGNDVKDAIWDKTYEYELPDNIKEVYNF